MFTLKAKSRFCKYEGGVSSFYVISPVEIWRHHVFGRVASARSYESGLRNGRWDISGEARHTENAVIRHGNMDICRAQEISNGDIDLEIIRGEYIWKCIKCPFRDMGHISLRNHLPDAHKECRPVGVTWSYFHATFPHMGPRKVIFLTRDVEMSKTTME